RDFHVTGVQTCALPISYRINHLRPGKDTIMRKPRDYDAELKALEDKAKELKVRKVQQLGELVIATGAGSLSADELAGALVALTEIGRASCKGKSVALGG